MGQRRKGVEDGDHHRATLEAQRVDHCVPVDANAGDGGVDQLDVDVGNAELQAHRMSGLAERPLLHQLERLEQFDLVDLEVRVGARHRDRRAEALDLFAGNADHRLARNGVTHVLRLGHRLIAAVDDPWMSDGTPPCMSANSWRCRDAPRTTPLRPSRLTTSALLYSVPISRAV